MDKYNDDLIQLYELQIDLYNQYSINMEKVIERCKELKNKRNVLIKPWKHIFADHQDLIPIIKNIESDSECVDKHHGTYIENLSILFINGAIQDRCLSTTLIIMKY